MNRTRPSLLLTAAAVALTALAGVAVAGPRGGKGGDLMHPRMIERMAERLALERDVVADIKSRVFEAQKQHVRLKSAAKLAKIELHQLLDQEAPDRDAVMRQIEAVGAARMALEKHRVGTMLEIRALLTPAQRRQLEVMRGEMKQRRRGHERRGRRGPPEPPERPEPPGEQD